MLDCNQLYRANADRGFGDRFRTSGNVVVVLTALSVMAYIVLLVLTLQLDG